MVRRPPLVAALVAALVTMAACTPLPSDGVPAPTVPTPPAGADVLVVGDSIAIGVSGVLTERLPGAEIDAVVGRQFADGIGVVQGRAAAGRLTASTVVVALGTNGAVTRTACDTLLGALAPRRVLVVNNAVPRSWEVQNNMVLAACARRHGATLVDWKTATLAGGLLLPDGVHLTSQGRTAWAALVTARV